MTKFEELLAAAEPIWKAYHEHPFVAGIREGTLEPEKFRYYILQDYLYLRDYARVFAVGTAKARSMDMMRMFADYARSLLDGEMDVHSGYLGVFGITHEELDNAIVHRDNVSYTTYMLRAAYDGGELEVLAAILSCMYSYEVIAKTMAERKPECLEHPMYGDWIRGYASEGFHSENVKFIEAFEARAAHCTPEQMKHLKELFVACSAYEMDFWNFAWNGPEQ